MSRTQDECDAGDSAPSAPTAGQSNSGDWSLTAHNAGLIRETVATNLRRERAFSGMSHGALARRSGLTKGSLARIEGSEREAKISTLVTIAIGLQAPLPSLLIGVPSASPGLNEILWVGDPTLAANWTLTPNNLRLLRVILGENLRRERKLVGLSQQILAGRTRVGEDTIIRTERAHQEPKLSTVVAWSFGLSVPLLSLLVGLPGTTKHGSREQQACTLSTGECP